ncbi:vWA domain-containing protein [Dactylosporangium darangshiense]|uniref:VWFA domain-containing protein n=1 Tax=Dactylosporangium darangshiense TaxID=579108 RepID=A0ABP8DS93_9ACTN
MITSPPNRSRRGRRRLTARLAACVAAAALSVLAPAAPAAHAEPPTPTDILRSLGLDDVPADYVILVDTSASMNAAGYEAARADVRALIADLSPRDYVALYTFDSAVTPRYLGPAKSPEAIVGALPAVPAGGATDFGAAIEAALREFGRAGAAPVAAAVLVTDGTNAPPAGSPYVDPSGPAWLGLRSRAAALQKSWIGGYAVPLVANGRGGEQALRSVLPNTVVINPAQLPDLPGYLDRSKTDARLDAAGAALAGDTFGGVSADWESIGTDRLRLTLRSDTTHVPLTVTGLAVHTDPAASVEADLPATIELAPGARRQFDITLHGLSGGRPFLPFTRAVREDVRLGLSGTVTSPWQDALRPRLDLKVRPAVRSFDEPVSVEVLARGATVTLVIWLSLVAVLAATLLAVRWRARNPRMPAGDITISALDDTRRFPLPLSGRRMRMELPSFDAKIDLRGRRTRGRERIDGPVRIVIRCTRHGRDSTSEVSQGGSVLISGLVFEHIPELRAPAYGSGRDDGQAGREASDGFL